MQPYPLWKFIVLIVVAVIGAIYAAPNLYGMQPAVQISLDSGEPLPAEFGGVVDKTLDAAGIHPDSSKGEAKNWVVRLPNEEMQLKAFDVLNQNLPDHDKYVVALNLVSRTPAWLAACGGKPIALALDLRGGVHLLIVVDANEVRKKAVERYVNDLPT